jgi:hypothetical protein
VTRKLTLPIIVLLVNLALVVGNLAMQWRIGQSQAKLQAAQAELIKAQAALQAAMKTMRPCETGLALLPGESCFIKITAPLAPGQSL